MSGRVTQLPVEVIVLPTSQKARMTQVPVEVIVLPTSQKARTTQLPVEAVISEEEAPPVGRVYGPAVGHM